MTIERTRAGNQFVLPGAERESVGTILQRRADKPLRPTQEQLPCDVGLFSDDADQTDLLLEIWEPCP
jgi:hypothetical protein